MLSPSLYAPDLGTTTSLLGLYAAQPCGFARHGATAEPRRITRARIVLAARAISVGTTRGGLLRESAAMARRGKSAGLGCLWGLLAFFVLDALIVIAIDHHP